jgi:hypothetical protein
MSGQTKETVRLLSEKFSSLFRSKQIEQPGLPPLDAARSRCRFLFGGIGRHWKTRLGRQRYFRGLVAVRLVG